MRTIWNSTLFMLERLVKLKEPLTITFFSLTDSLLSLDSDDWNVIEDIIPLSKPFNSRAFCHLVLKKGLNIFIVDVTILFDNHPAAFEVAAAGKRKPSTKCSVQN